MRTIGLIGGMSWESTALYYKHINEGVRDRLGPLRSASLILYSFDFEGIKELQYAGNWDECGRQLAEAAGRLEAAGAEAIVLCTNTMHKVADYIEARIAIPFLHLADATAERICAAGYRRPALLGTRFTMEEDFYADRLRARGLEVVIPEPQDRAEINRVIYEELCVGTLRDESRDAYRNILGKLVASGVDAVILGCTEITLLIGPADVSVPTFDTTAIHAEEAVAFLVDERVSRPTELAART